MPLDTASFSDDLDLSFGSVPTDAEREAVIDTYSSGLDSAPTIGAALRAIREFRGLDLEDLAQATRIRKNYLMALEEMRLEDLPSRPFIIGYIRAYARALQLDPETAVAKFRLDVPEEDGALREPVGVRRERDPRLTLFLMAGAVVVIGVAVWNVAQHSMPSDAPSHGVSAEVAQSAAKSAELPPPVSAQGAVALGAPLPAPPESTTPTPYVTPGLENVTGGQAAASGAPAASPAAAVAPTPFVAQGTVYGAPAAQSTLTVQASKSASLVVHGPGGVVYFAKELAAGEAYRVPQIGGISLDASDPLAFNYFVGGMLKGALPAAQSTASQLTQ